LKVIDAASTSAQVEGGQSEPVRLLHFVLHMPIHSSTAVPQVQQSRWNTRILS
jgi:hypothetical protein